MNAEQRWVRERSTAATLGGRMRSLPIAPLVSLVGEPSRKTMGDAIYSSWRRAQETGRITLDAADKVCIQLLGCHPAEVYGMAWWNA